MKPILAITDEQLSGAVASMNLLGVEPAFGFGKKAVTTERYRWSDQRPEDISDVFSEYGTMLSDHGRKIDVSTIKRDLRDSYPYAGLRHRKIAALRVNHPMASYHLKTRSEVLGDFRNRLPRSRQAPCMAFPVIVGLRKRTLEPKITDVIILDGWSRISAMQNFIQNHAISRYNELKDTSVPRWKEEELAAENLYFNFVGDFYLPAVVLTEAEWISYITDSGAA